MIDHINAMLHLGVPSWIAGAIVSISFGIAAWNLYNDRSKKAVRRATKGVGYTLAGAVLYLSFLVGGIMSLATIAVAYSVARSLWRVLGARTMRTFMHRLVLAVQRVITTTVIAVIVVSVTTGGVHFYGAPLFIGVAVLLAWTLKTNEASVDRKDRLVTVTRRYA